MRQHQHQLEDVIRDAPQSAADPFTAAFTATDPFTAAGQSTIEDAPPPPPGRVDEGLFSDALQAADDLQELGFFHHGEVTQRATDRVDDMLLQTIEVEMDGLSTSFPSVSPEPTSNPEHLVGNDPGRLPLEAAQPFSPEGPVATDHRRSSEKLREAHRRSSEKPRVGTCNAFPRAWHLIQQIAVSTLTHLYHETLRLFALVPLMVWIIMEASELEGGSSVDMGDLLLWPFLFWLVVRAAAIVGSKVPISVLMLSRTHLPLPLFLILQSMEGWPLAVFLCGVLLVVGTEIHVWNCAEAIERIHTMNQWWAVYSWWLVLGLGFGVMLGLTRLYISMTTSRHYKQRANEVYQAQKVLRRIFHAARSKQQQHRWVARSLEKRKQSAGIALEVTENRLSQIASGSAPPIGSVTAHGHLLGRRFCKRKAVLAASHASATAADALPMTDVAFNASHPNNGPPSSPSLSRSASKASLSETTVPDLTPGLAQQLMSLAGPLHLSGDSNASTLSSARRKAGKCFDLLVQHAELLAGPADALTSKQQPALVRERLLRWAYKSNLDSIGPNALFGADKVLDKEMFVSSVERCYKEQRLLTASVTTFDQINTSLIHFSMIVWYAAPFASSFWSPTRPKGLP